MISQSAMWPLPNCYDRFLKDGMPTISKWINLGKQQKAQRLSSLI